MSQKRNLFWSLTVQAITILLASMFAFQACNLFGTKLILLPVVIVSIYIPLKLIFHYFIYMFKELESTTSTDGVNENTSQDVNQEESDLILLKKEWSYFIMNINKSISNTFHKKKEKKTKSYVPY